MFELSLPLWGVLLVFCGSAATIGFVGVKLAGLADRLADRTGQGEAITGTVFLGLITALPGLERVLILHSYDHFTLPWEGRTR